MRAPRLVDEGSVWVLVAPLSLWAGHFLLCYWVAAIWCAKVAGETLAPLGTVRVVVLGLTVLAGLVLALLVRTARRRYSGVFRVDEAITDASDKARERFLGHVALLLCALAGVAMVMTAVPVLVFDQCW